MQKPTSNQHVVEDQYQVLAEPGGNYVTHVTPDEGSGVALADEIVSVGQERGVDIRVIGMDVL